MSSPTKLRLDDQLCFALYAATNSVTRAYRPLLDEIGLTYPQYLVMMVLWQDDGLPVHQIASRLALAPHAISPLLRRLEDAGLVVRRQDTADRRVVHVHLTASGVDLEESAARAQLAVVDQTRLCPPELHGLRDELHHLIRRMSAGLDLAAEPEGPPPPPCCLTCTPSTTSQGEPS